MPTRRPDDVLTVGVDLDPKAALAAMQKFQRAMKTEMQGISKSTKSLDKTNQKLMKGAIDGIEDWEDAVEDLSDVTEKHERILKNLEDRAKSAAGAELDGLREQISLLKKITAGKKTAAGAGAKKGGRKGGGGVALGGGGGEDRESFRDVARDFKDALKDSIGSFFAKDAKGLAESATKILGKGLKLGFKAVPAAGAGLSNLGGKLQKKGDEKIGAGGAMMGAMGTALKGLGGVLGKFGPLLQMVGKLGPILSTVGSVLVSVVKLFIDAEAGAKQFQKELLATASTTEFLADAGGDSVAAFDELEKTVKGVRDAAFSLDNIKYGITPEETKAVVSALNQEGVSLRSIGAEAKQAGQTVQDFTGELVHSSVAYSRAFGVPLQEINSMQAELFTEMGQNLQKSRLSFAQMTLAASDSGIASNKFFAIIRGVSADLSLYNTRLEDAVKTLGLLGKVMSPRNAQKFMQTAMQALKGMGRLDRLKVGLLGGSTMAKAVQRDLDRKAKNIAQTIEEAGGKAGMTQADLLSKPYEELLQGVKKEQQGTLREAVSSLRMDTKANKKGAFGTAIAARNLGPAGALQAMKAALNIGGTGKLRDRRGDLGTEMMAENLGISEEQLDSMAKFEEAIDDERQTLKKGLADGDKNVIAKLSKAGLKTAKDIDAAGYDQIYDALDKSTQELMKADAGVQDMGKTQAKLTSSVLDKLGQLVEFVMNQIYNIMMGIWEAITDLPFFGGAEKKRHIQLMKMIKEGSKSGSNTVSKALSKVTSEGGDAEAVKAIMEEGGQKLTDALLADTEGNEKATEAQQKLVDSLLSKGGAAATMKAARGTGVDFRLRDLVVARKVKSETDEAKKQGMSEDQIDQMSESMTKRFHDLFKHDQDALAKELEKQGGFSAEELQEAGLSGRDIAQLASQIGQHMDLTSLADAFPDFEKQAGSVMRALDPKLQEESAKAVIAGSDANQAVADQGARPGRESLSVKFGPNFLRGKYKRTIAEAVLSSLRTALFEFYMYSKLDPKDVVQMLNKEKMSPSDFVAGYTGGSIKKGEPLSLTDKKDIDAMKPNAAGGLVTDVDGGLANVRAAAGEGLASIGPGERILPAGGRGAGGGVNIPVTVNGVGGQDLARMIQAAIIDTVAEYKRKERYS